MEPDPANNIDAMYREELLEYYNHPTNRGAIEDAQIKFSDQNPLCGDKVELFAKLDVDGKKITQVKFQGSGCVISMASASMISEYVEGKLMDDIRKMTREDMLSLLGLELTPSRVKCAMLALTALKKGIMEYESKKINTTEMP